MNFWLIKSEPDTWSWEDQCSVAEEPWNGVRNYQARNNLRAMEVSDLAFFYHSNKQKAIVGIVEIVKTAYPDSDNENFSVVDVRMYKAMNRPITLQEIKNNPKLINIPLVKHSRLSVMPLKKEDFLEILKISNTKI